MKPRLVVAILFLAGFILFSYSLFLPYYKDPKAAEMLLQSSYGNSKSDYYTREAELRTSKLTFMDVGSGLLIASATILLFLFIKQVRFWSDLTTIKTLGKIMILILSNIAWLALIPGTVWYYWYRAGRGDYPPFADSIGIPISESTPVILTGLLLLNLFLVLTSIRAKLPTQLFIKAGDYKRAVIFWEVFFGFWIALNTLLLVGFVIDGDHITIPVNLFFTFVLLSLRAGQISKYKKAISISV